MRWCYPHGGYKKEVNPFRHHHYMMPFRDYPCCNIVENATAFPLIFIYLLVQQRVCLGTIGSGGWGGGLALSKDTPHSSLQL